MNKKADERVLSIYLFIVYIIVAIGIISGVIIFYGSPLDVRLAEASILSSKVIDCITEQGYLKLEVLEDDYDLMKSCYFDFSDKANQYGGEEQFAVRLIISNLSSCSKAGEEELLEVICSENLKIEEGNEKFLEFCTTFTEKVEGKKIPKCDESAIYILNKDERTLLRVLSAVKKIENV